MKHESRQPIRVFETSLKQRHLHHQETGQHRPDLVLPWNLFEDFVNSEACDKFNDESCDISHVIWVMWYDSCDTNPFLLWQLAFPLLPQQYPCQDHHSLKKILMKSLKWRNKNIEWRHNLNIVLPLSFSSEASASSKSRSIWILCTDPNVYMNHKKWVTIWVIWILCWRHHDHLRRHLHNSRTFQLWRCYYTPF